MDGKFLKRKILECGKTQKEVAELLGISPQAMTSILNASDVRSGTIERLCKVLDLPISFFYEGSTFEKEHKSLENNNKDREILYLRGQVSAYEKALGIMRNTSFEKTDAV